jgi:hypothetical protein
MPDLSALLQNFGEVNRQPYGQSRPGFTGMMTGIMNNRDKAKQLKSWDTAAKAIYSALEPEEDVLTGAKAEHPLGMNKDQFNMLSTPDRIAKVKATVTENILKSAMAEQKQKQELEGQVMEMNKLKIAEAMAEQQANEGFRQQAQGAPIARALQQGLGPIRPGPTTMEDLMQAARANPTARNAGPLLQTALREMGGESQAGAPEMTTLGKVDTIFNRKTGQFQLSPYSKEEAKPEEGTIELPDPDNPVFGPRIRIPISVAEKKYPHLLKGLQAPGSASTGTGKGKPTRAIAKEFVAKHGKAKAIEELKKAGYDPSGYAD